MPRHRLAAMPRRVPLVLLWAVLVALSVTPTSAVAGALDLPGCRDHALARNDDGSSGAVGLPFRVDFYGTTYDEVYVNNNGNVTFDAPLSTYVPFDLTQTDRVIVAPFFADVDTRPADGGDVTYGETSFDGAPAFCVLWDGVGYYDQRTDRHNTFELLLIRRTPTGGDFDIVFRYAGIAWELGEASDNVPAHAGFSNGDLDRSVEISGSGEHGAFLDGGPASLVEGAVNSDQPGTWRFHVRSGTAGNDPRNVPPGYARYTNWWDWPDRDDDGLPDFWEDNGVWVGDRQVDLPGMGADPDRKDAFVYVDVVAGERWNDEIEGLLRSAFAQGPLRIALHVVHGRAQLERASVPSPVTAAGPQGDALFASLTRHGFTDSGLAGAPGSVPALAKYVCVCPDHADVTDGEGRITPGSSIGGEANGIRADHLLVTMYESKWMDKIESDTGIRFANDALTSDRLNAVTTMHELGHLYGLRHHGREDTPTVDRSYLSVMSYAYSAFGVPRPPDEALATGDLLPRIDYSQRDIVNRDWRMGGDAGALSLVYGQHGERGNFYTVVDDIAEPTAPAPVEAGIDELLADPEIRSAIAEAAAPLREATPAPPPAPAATPTTGASVPVDRTKPRGRIVRLSVGRVTGRGRKARAVIKVRVSAGDDRTPSEALVIRCALDNKKPVSCRSRVFQARVRPGRHRFRLVVQDSSGNRVTVVRHFVVRRASVGRKVRRATR